jgi:hypothetical protein
MTTAAVEVTLNLGKKFAVKVMSLKKIDPPLMAMMREELETLCELDHPYIATYVY